MSKGIFITLEGIDGSGKSSHWPFFTKFFLHYGKFVLSTREPGGTVLGEELRNLILNQEMSPYTETLLLYATREEHLKQIIKPALNIGQVVICDRYIDSTWAYQVCGKNLDYGLDTSLSSKVLQPDLTLLFDVSVETAIKRRNERNQNTDRFENEDKNFHNRVRFGYLGLLEDYPDRIKVIDAEQSIENVQQQIEKILIELMSTWK